MTKTVLVAAILVIASTAGHSQAQEYACEFHPVGECGLQPLAMYRRAPQIYVVPGQPLAVLSDGRLSNDEFYRRFRDEEQRQ